jgi:hypothetical protein
MTKRELLFCIAMGLLTTALQYIASLIEEVMR